MHFVDVGTSGGVFGLERGYCLMIGGEDPIVEHLDPIFKTLAPGIGSAPRTPGREGPASASEQGYLHCGGHGAGHFVKMVHNGIEYGIMGAIAEGLAVLKKADVGMQDHAEDAETAPLRNPEYYQYRFDMPEVAEVWRRGSVIGSWLLDLTATALAEDADVAGFSGRVSDSGEGRWTALAAVEEGVPGAHPDDGAVRALQLARRGGLRRQAALGDAQAVRRASRAGAEAVSGARHSACTLGDRFTRC